MLNSLERNPGTIGNFSNPQQEDILDFTSKIKNIISQIDKINSNSEKDFLEIGSRLTGFLSKTNNLHKISVEAATSISEKILKEGIDPLTVLLKEFSGFLSQSAGEIRGDISVLQEINEKIEKIIDEQSGFNKIVKQLKMLGVSTKIESVRLGSDDQGFYSLAENVDKLSSHISDKSKSIKDKATILKDTMLKAIQKLNSLEGEHKKQSEAILVNTSASIADLNEKFNQCSRKVNAVSGNVKMVHSNIGQLVTSIQFHDITRQQMEHVKEILADQIEMIENNRSADELVLLETVSDICALQSAQFAASVDQFYGASENIVSSLRGIERNAASIFAESCELLSERRGNESTSLSKIKSELSIISGNLRENEKISSELSQSIIDVLRIVDELSNNVKGIQEIGDEIEMIALNSRVKAAKTGINGSALGVLSEAIQKLSVAAKEQSYTTTNLLDIISGNSEKLRTSISSVSNSGKNNEITDIEEKVARLIESTIEIEKRAELMVEELKSNVGNLQNELNSAIDNLIVHEFVKQKGSGIISEMDYMAEKYSDGKNTDEARIERTKKYISKYTMNSERSIHNMFIASDNGSFTPASGSDELDDNIELF